MAQGKVKWFNEKNGFGYIEMDDGGDVLVLQTAIEKTGLKKLTFGQLVNFDLVQGPPRGCSGKHKSPVGVSSRQIITGIDSLY